MDISLPLILSLGLIVGFVLSLTGAGGAILSVPLLVLVVGLPISQASPIGLLAVAISAGIGALVALKKKELRYKAAALMALFGVFASPLGIFVAHHTPHQPLSALFSVVLMYVAVKMIIAANWQLKGITSSTQTPPPCLLDESIGKLIWNLPCARALAMSGTLAGFFSGLLGVGGGFIIVPSLNKYTDLAMKWIIATSLGVLTMVSTVGVVAATISGKMNWTIAVPFACGALLGMLPGKVLAHRLAGPKLQIIFGVFSLCIALTMLWHAFL